MLRRFLLLKNSRWSSLFFSALITFHWKLPETFINIIPLFLPMTHDFNPYIERYRLFHLIFLFGFLLGLALFATIFFHIFHRWFLFSLVPYTLVFGALFVVYVVYWAQRLLPQRHIIRKKRHWIFVGLFDGFQAFGHTFATLLNFILLSFVYFVGVGLTFVIAKLFGKRFLDLKKSSSLSSYWEDYHLGKKELSSYFRQF
jgi:hypothetical protein